MVYKMLRTISQPLSCSNQVWGQHAPLFSQRRLCRHCLPASIPDKPAAVKRENFLSPFAPLMRRKEVQGQMALIFRQRRNPREGICTSGALLYLPR